MKWKQVVAVIAAIITIAASDVSAACTSGTQKTLADNTIVVCHKGRWTKYAMPNQIKPSQIQQRATPVIVWND